MLYENFNDDVLIFAKMESAIPLQTGEHIDLLFRDKIELTNGKLIRAYDEIPTEFHAETEFIKGEISGGDAMAFAHYETAARYSHKEAIKVLVSRFEKFGKYKEMDYWKEQLARLERDSSYLKYGRSL